MKKVKNILLLLTAIFTLGCSQTIVFEDVQTPTPTPTPKPEPEPDDKQLTSAPYAVGDYYYDGTKEGVVFDVWDNGNSGKIVSMTQSGVLRWSSDETEQKRLIGADSETDGAYNTAKVKAISGWETKYPAFKWCADLGDDWYLPAKEELRTIYNNKDKLNTNLTDMLSSNNHWSSTEDDEQYDGQFSAWFVNMGSGTTYYYYKRSFNYVRAVATFGDAQQSDPTPEPEITSAPYAVGDYYNDGTKEGVVFEVWDNGNSGKIVSMMQSTRTFQWSSDETEQKRLIGADSETDGAANMAVVKAISGWESKYPAFKWCADLGDGWYLPAKEELLTIYNNKDKLNTNLTDKLSSYYWSSTESDYQGSNGSFYAWYVFMSSGYTTYQTKFTDRYVRAVATFGNVPKPEPEPEITSAPYAVGDYYNDGTKEGVVFEVSADGTSGKIVSMTQSGELQWSSDETEQKRLIGADSETDGVANMAVVKAISSWETKYPAFKWCADLGDGWYLPAKEELLTIYNNKDKLNTNLTDMLSSNNHWSSTENDKQYSTDYFCACVVSMTSGITGNGFKSNYEYVRAAATFGDTPKPEPEPEPDFDDSTATDLSAEGTANCYLVKSAGTYKFKAVKGNSAQSVGAASSADVLWESFGTSTTPNVGDLIASATYKDGYVYFATPNTFKNGNASIAVRDSNGTVLWSWHIWLSKEGWNDHVYANNAGTMMDRNLGATSATPGSVGALGLMYQWGRKDPFLGSSSVSSSTLAVSTGTWSSVTTQQTVDYVTANPMTFVRQNYEWCTGDGAEDSNYEKRWTESEKSMYDPCPVGYRVPDGGKNGFWATALGTSSSTTAGITWYSTYYGCLWTLSDGKLSAWYPIVGCRDTSGGALGNVGSIGYYWSASTHASDGERAYYLCFYDSKVSTTNYVNRCLGQSVRCVSTTATSEPTPGITSAPYAVGDYYNDGTKEGVVFEVWDNGNSGKIVSMMMSTGSFWTSDETEQKRLIGADSETDGAYNTAKVKAISGWETKYPAFKWCADLGDGWYLPAKEELITMYNNKDMLNTNLTDKLLGFHWSSTEYDYQDSNGYFCAWLVQMYYGNTDTNSKNLGYYVRAVTTF